MKHFLVVSFCHSSVTQPYILAIYLGGKEFSATSRQAFWKRLSGFEQCFGTHPGAQVLFEDKDAQETNFESMFRLFYISLPLRPVGRDAQHCHTYVFVTNITGPEQKLQ